MRDLIEFIHNGGGVRRFHTVRTLTDNTVAEHSFGVAWFAWLLTEGTARPKLLMACLAHDLAEQLVGDVPSPAKRALGVGNDLDELENKILEGQGLSFSLTPEEQRTLKLADCFDGMMFCLRERKMGSTLTNDAFFAYAGYVAAMKPSGVEAKILDTINELHRKAEGTDVRG